MSVGDRCYRADVETLGLGKERDVGAEKENKNNSRLANKEVIEHSQNAFKMR